MENFSYDTFHRANQSGLGTASDGTPWNLVSGSLTYSISGNKGIVTGNSGDAFQILDKEIYTREDIVTSFQTSNSNNTKMGLVARYQNTANLYVAFFDFTVQFGLIGKIVGGSFSTLVGDFVTFSANTDTMIRFSLIGSLLSAKIWTATQREPTNPNLQVTDTSLPSLGKIGMFNNVTAGTLTINSFSASSSVNNPIPFQAKRHIVGRIQ